MQLLTIAQIVFGATAALVTLSLLGTAFDRVSRLKLRELLRTTRRVDEQLVRAQARLSSQIAREVDERNAELERTLARARADSISLLAEQERRIAEERRSSALERSRLAADEL